MQVCHLSHLLLCRELLPKLKISRGRIVFLTTQTHSPNSLPGKIPPQARLGDLSSLAAGLGPRTTGMVDSGPFEPKKAYKDAKAANVLTMRALSDQYGRDGGDLCGDIPGMCRQQQPLPRKAWLIPLRILPACSEVHH